MNHQSPTNAMTDLISEAEIMAIKESFALFDINLLGYLDFETISTLLSRLNYDVSNLESFLHRDQTISFNQFSNLIARHLRSGFDPLEIESIFHELDADNTGTINSENFSTIFKKFNQDVSLEDSDLYLSSISPETGEINFQQFQGIVKDIGKTEAENKPKPKPKPKRKLTLAEKKRKKVNENIGTLLSSLS